MKSRAKFVAAFAAVTLAWSAPLPAQDGAASRVGREQMWFAPTAEDWAKPVLVKFQRTLEDAQAVAKESGRAVLVCVNMDGEIASEHYAGVRYRRPETAKFFEPYVCVMASVYRHTPRDYDEEGRRILCPRFGSVTCGEHIALEPIVYEKYLDGKRIAPRHIGVELDGTEMYDVYYAWDTDSVFKTIADGTTKRPPAKPVVKGDRSLLERVASPDAEDKAFVENAFASGGESERRALLEAALKSEGKASIDLLRLGVYGLDREQNRMARKALTDAGGEAAVDLVADALRTPMDAADRDALVGALGRMGEASPKARTLTVVYRGLATKSAEVDPMAWAGAIEGAGASGDVASARSARGLYTWAQDLAATPEAAEAAAHESLLADKERILASGDGAALIGLAEATLRKARQPDVAPGEAAKLYAEARSLGRKAEENGAGPDAAAAVKAVAAFGLGDMAEARDCALVAVKSLPPAPTSWNASIVLGLFIESRINAVVKAVRQKEEWPSQWIADVNAAYAVLEKHPHGSDDHVVGQHKFLFWLGAKGQAARALDSGMTRFPGSPMLHEIYRRRVLDERGAAGLEPAYAALLKQLGDTPSLRWFSGYASAMTAEAHRAAQKPALAVAAYDRAIADYDRSSAGDPSWKDEADKYAALALAGKARMAMDSEDYPSAVELLLASFARDEEAAPILDGLNFSPGDTSRTLMARIKEKKLVDLEAKLGAVLKKMDPELLRLPAYETAPPDGSAPQSRPRRGPRRP